MLVHSPKKDSMSPQHPLVYYIIFLPNPCASSGTLGVSGKPNTLQLIITWIFLK